MNEKVTLTVKDVIQRVDILAPRDRAEEWDHVGLMIGSENTEVKGIVLALDVTSEAMERCRSSGANLIITHHPLFFAPCFSIDTDTPQGNRIAKLLGDNIAVFSAHTNLDRADYSVNHALAEMIGLEVVNSPEDCRFGLICKSREPEMYMKFSDTIREILNSSGVFLNSAEDRKVRSFYLCAGSFDEAIIPEILRLRVDAVITGEMKHHAMVTLNEAGVKVIAAGHEATERVILPFLEKSLRENFPELPIAVAHGNQFNRFFSGQPVTICL